eukprot:14888194-Heterocapsa_arctica.AAC.1
MGIRIDGKPLRGSMRVAYNVDWPKAWKVCCESIAHVLARRLDFGTRCDIDAIMLEHLLQELEKSDHLLHRQGHEGKA